MDKKKPRSVMEQFGYQNCYRVTDYKHPFDKYDGEDVLIFEESYGQLKITEMLNYLDGYPLKLPRRYFNRQACFTKVCLISNISLADQYCSPSIVGSTRQAFLRRLHDEGHMYFDAEKLPSEPPFSMTLPPKSNLPYTDRSTNMKKETF